MFFSFYHIVSKKFLDLSLLNREFYNFFLCRELYNINNIFQLSYEEYKYYTLCFPNNNEISKIQKIFDLSATLFDENAIDINRESLICKKDILLEDLLEEFVFLIKDNIKNCDKITTLITKSILTLLQSN